MMAGCCVDDCSYGCSCADDCSWAYISIGRIKMDENKKGPFDSECCCCEDKPSIPTPSYLTWVREHMSHEKYVSYLLGKYYESRYYFTNHGHRAGELARMNFYLTQIISELDEKASEKK